jgi:hypothetical protein
MPCIALSKVDEILLLGQYREGMRDNRKNSRYRTLAHVRIPGIIGEEGLLKDLSVTGCCVESTSFAGIQLNTRYRIEILPESAAKIDGFELLAESLWTRPGGYSCEIGFTIIESPRGKTFQRYVDYLAWRSSAANTSNLQ